MALDMKKQLTEELGLEMQKAAHEYLQDFTEILHRRSGEIASLPQPISFAKMMGLVIAMKTASGILNHSIKLFFPNMDPTVSPLKELVEQAADGKMLEVLENMDIAKA